MSEKKFEEWHDKEFGTFRLGGTTYGFEKLKAAFNAGLATNSEEVERLIEAAHKLTGLCMHDFETIGVGPIEIARTRSGIWECFMRDHKEMCDALAAVKVLGGK